MSATGYLSRECISAVGKEVIDLRFLASAKPEVLDTRSVGIERTVLTEVLPFFVIVEKATKVECKSLGRVSQ